MLDREAAPPVPLPILEVFCKALVLAEVENAPEIGVDHLLAALGGAITESQRVEDGVHIPAPHREKALSSEARAAIEAASSFEHSSFEQLSINSLRTALLATKLRDDTNSRYR